MIDTQKLDNNTLNCLQRIKCTFQSVKIVPNCKCFEKSIVTGNQAEVDQGVTGNTVV